MTTLFAFLHHLAAFSLVAALAIEFVLIRDEITVRSARRLLAIDALYGLSAGIVLVVGMLRVFLFEKGAWYYFHSIPFIGKLSLFVAVGLLSIYPTKEFVSWRSAVRRNEAPVVDPARQLRIRRIIHWELAAVVGILLCAALMARGIGFAGSR